MILTFVTKKDINGNRYYLTVDFEKKVFSRIDRWYNSEFIQVRKHDQRRIIEELKNNGFSECDYL